MDKCIPLKYIFLTFKKLKKNYSLVYAKNKITSIAMPFCRAWKIVFHLQIHIMSNAITFWKSLGNCISRFRKVVLYLGICFILQKALRKK